MKVLILAGGLGSRLSEETDVRPKPMVEIGGKPILWHIMKIYSYWGFNDFIVLLGYKGYLIKEYFVNYFLHQSDITVNLANNSVDILNVSSEPWKVTLLDTGVNCMTGGRIKKAEPFIDGENFMLTYGDGVADIDLSKLLEHHKSHNSLVTITSAQPDGRFGALELDLDNQIKSFDEKPKGDGSWVNAGFFVCSPKVMNYITAGDQTVFEQEPLQNLAKDGYAFTYKHNGFWMPMDTLRDKVTLSKMWDEGMPPWKKW